MKTIAQQINWDFEANGTLLIEDKNGKRYFELADGFWARFEYDSKGKQIYWENSIGYWAMYEYDSQGNVIFFENSNGQIYKLIKP